VNSPTCAHCGPEDAALTLGWRNAQRALPQRRRRQGSRTAGGVDRQPSRIRVQLHHRTENGHSVGMLSLVGIDRANRHGEPGRFLIGDEAATQVPAAVVAMKLLYELAFDRLACCGGIIAANNTLMIKWQNTWA
jgi:diamine N-acetyltransferase